MQVASGREKQSAQAATAIWQLRLHYTCDVTTVVAHLILQELWLAPFLFVPVCKSFSPTLNSYHLDDMLQRDIHMLK